MNDTPPQKFFFYTPSPLSGVSDLFFMYKVPRQSRTEALLEVSKIFRESAFSGTFSAPPKDPPVLNLLRRVNLLSIVNSLRR